MQVIAADARAAIKRLARLNAFIALTDEDGEGPLVAVKDVVDVQGMLTTTGASARGLRPAAEDADVIRAIRSGGCLVIGKTNLSVNVACANPHYGRVLNPRDERRITGGSSGGSAAAVAAGLCSWAIGTDTGGSVRMPASLCGVVGFKPTLGLVSTQGVSVLSPTLDTVGVLAPGVRTAASAIALMSGRPELVSEEVGPAFGSYRLGVPSRWLTGLDHDVARAWRGLETNAEEVAVPDLERMVATHKRIVRPEAVLTYRDRLSGDADYHDQEVQEYLEIGLRLGAVDYLQARRERERICHEVEVAMLGLDALILPTTPCVAPVYEEGVHPDDDLLRFARPFNVTGQPAISVPVPGTGLPVGIQLVGRFGEDAKLLQMAQALEQLLLATFPEGGTSPR
ncbi:amidase [bacterium]|nr:MAG: amidase [bacterium]